MKRRPRRRAPEPSRAWALPKGSRATRIAESLHLGSQAQNLSRWNSVMKTVRPEWRGFKYLVKRRRKAEASFAKRRLEERAKLRERLAAPAERTPASKKRPGFAKGYKFAVRYRGPNGELWSGHGSTPRWMRPLLHNGKKKSDFLARRAEKSA